MQQIGATKAFQDRNIVLKGADIATQRGWTGVPNFILESKEISAGAKLTYAMLLKYAREEDQCFPGQERLAKDMGIEVEFVPTKWEGLIPSLLTGKFDLVIAGMTGTPQRALKINFTQPYDFTGTQICIHHLQGPL